PNGDVITDATPIYEVTKGGAVISDYTDLELGEYVVSLKSFDGTKYEAVGETTKTVTLSSAQPNAEVSFTLKKKSTPTPPPQPPVQPKGSLTLRVADVQSGQVITDADAEYEVTRNGVVVPTLANLALGRYEVRLK
ncbi:hypothetical protein, partial [Bacillus licheniformis]|uniref:hypothetical protein n=1 Tax=Bacillus licheniformis TaxID=1402 RepID=UPI00163A79C4